jgi:hypothetical protein
VDAGDAGQPIDLNAVLRNVSSSGFEGYTLQLSGGSFASACIAGRLGRA